MRWLLRYGDIGDVTNPLLPERHPVRDFFVLDTLDMLPRSDMATMEHPIYSLSTRPDRRQLSYTQGEARLEIIPSSLGLPTVFDKDIIIYCISKLVAMRDRGEAIGRVVRITTHDLLVETNRPINNLGYQRLLPALNRLRGVVINTTITTGEERSTRGFGLIDEFEYNRKGSMFAERLKYLEICLSDWIFRAIQSAEVLPISRDYFRLRAPVDRRIYEIARKHCGRQTSWRVGTDLLQKKVGSKQAVKHFHAHLRGLVSSNHLPDYAVTIEGEQTVFYRRSAREAAPVMPPVIDAGARAANGRAVPPAKERKIAITADAFDAVLEIAPGWDRYALESSYKTWAATKDVARSEDARFLAWVASYTKNRKP